MGKKLIVLLTIIFICSTNSLFLFPIPNNKKSKYLLPKQEIIIEEAKFIFKPVFEVTKESEILKILIEITSYINQDLVDLNYSKITMLECEDNFYQSINYEVIEKTNNRLIVQLVFEPDNFIIKKTIYVKSLYLSRK